MAAADEAEHRHAGGARGGDAGDAVLDHQAIARRGAHRARRVQEKIGMGFPARPRRRKKCSARTASHSRRPEREAEPLGRARRRDANRDAQAPDRLPHAFDSLEFGANVASISRDRSSGNSYGSGARVRSRPCVRPNRASARETARASPRRQLKPGLAEPARVTASAITSLSTSTPSQSNMTTSGQRAFQGRVANLRSARRRISCARRFRAWNAEIAPPAGPREARWPTSTPSPGQASASRRYGADHRRAQQHRLRRLRRLDRLADASAMICRTSGLCAAPPLTTIASNS